MRILICAGGTGGGVYPALAVHKAILKAQPAVEILWVGGEGGMEAGLVDRAGIPFKSIPAAGVHGVDIRRLPANIASILKGISSSAKILKEFKPDVLFFTGGFVAVPMALAGKSLPKLLFVPDIEPGLALKVLSGFSTRITVTSVDSKKYFPPGRNIIPTGYPVRADLAEWNRQNAREFFEIDENARVMLVFGGSKGARSINNALFLNLERFLKNIEIIHISGELDWPNVEKQQAYLKAALRRKYHAYPYLHKEMGAALAASDLVLSRAGASILGEFPFFELPAVLVPYPYAWRYQKVNADALTKRGAAIMIEDQLLENSMVSVIEQLFNSSDTLQSMRSAMASLRTPDAAEKIAAQLFEIAGETHDQY